MHALLTDTLPPPPPAPPSTNLGAAVEARKLKRGMS
jgi:hypothetical protein